MMIFWRTDPPYKIVPKGNTFAKSGKRDRAFVVWSEITTNQELHKAHAGYFTVIAVFASVSDEHKSWTIRAHHCWNAGDDGASDDVRPCSMGGSGWQLSNGTTLFLQQLSVG